MRLACSLLTAVDLTLRSGLPLLQFPISISHRPFQLSVIHVSNGIETQRALPRFRTEEVRQEVDVNRMFQVALISVALG
jgi:hypothetical protein